ncbi:MAG: hypothetical protein ACM3Q1_02295 [Bacteroidales bacterium]
MALSRVQWVALRPEQAQRHPLYGFGGWNWLLLAQFLLNGAAAIYFLPAPWGIAAGLLLMVPVVPLALGARIFRPIFFGYAGLLALAAFASMIPKFVASTGVTPGAGMPPALFVLFAMAVYVNESRRLNVTLCHRVRSDDPFLTEAAP